MNKIVYLLGAGASAEALPTVAQFASRVQEFSKYFENKSLVLGGVQLRNSEDSFKISNFKESLLWLVSESKRHISIDTFARKLYVKKDNKSLRRLKAIVTAYFTIEQQLHSVDKRYDAFFSTIIEEDPFKRCKIPDNIKILTWNYDTQLEKGYYEYCQDKEIVMDDITFNEKQFYHLNG